jgi:cyclopropane fatty-acyl-phospholipid synthase-like methyltransferase
MGMSVLEIGAGIGDHSHYYMDRDCKITITEARPENIKYMRKHYPGFAIQFLDIEHPTRVDGSPFDVVHRPSFPWFPSSSQIEPCIGLS